MIYSYHRWWHFPTSRADATGIYLQYFVHDQVGVGARLFVAVLSRN